MTNHCTHTAGITFRAATASGGNDNGPNCVEPGQFRKAEASNPIGSCVEVTTFHKAEASGANGHCVQTAYATASASGQHANRVAVAPASADACNSMTNCVEVAHAKATKSWTGNNCVEPGLAAEDEHATCTPETCRTPGINPGDVVIRDSKLGEDSPLAVYPLDEWRTYVSTVIENGMEPGGPLGYVLRDFRNPSLVLNFNQGEADAFRDGCTKGEFNYDLSAVAA